MSKKHLDLQAQEAVASHQWKKKMDLTTDDDHGILRLNNSCRVQSVTKTQRKKKVDSQKVDELYTANLGRGKTLNAIRVGKKKKKKGNWFKKENILCNVSLNNNYQRFSFAQPDHAER